MDAGHRPVNFGNAVIGDLGVVTGREGEKSLASAMIADPVAHVMCLIPMFHHPLRHARSSIRNRARV